MVGQGTRWATTRFAAPGGAVTVGGVASTPTSPTGPGPLTDRVRADLRAAMQSRDTRAVSVLRTLLAAFENAAAPPEPGAGTARLPTPPVIGRLVEHPRLQITDDDRRGLVRDEIADRSDTAEQYRRGGRADAAAELEAEIALLQRYL
jgi:uncharacterized protein YqeY